MPFKALTPDLTTGLTGPIDDSRILYDRKSAALEFVTTRSHGKVPVTVVLVNQLLSRHGEGSNRG